MSWWPVSPSAAAPPRPPTRPPGLARPRRGPRPRLSVRLGQPAGWVAQKRLQDAGGTDDRSSTTSADQRLVQRCHTPLPPVLISCVISTVRSALSDVAVTLRGDLPLRCSLLHPSPTSSPRRVHHPALRSFHRLPLLLWDIYCRLPVFPRRLRPSALAGHRPS